MSIETRYTLDMPVDVSALVKQSSPTIPILVMFTKDPDAANSIVSHAATQRNVKLLAVALTNDLTASPSQLQVVERLVQDAMVEVSIESNTYGDVKSCESPVNHM